MQTEQRHSTDRVLSARALRSEPTLETVSDPSRFGFPGVGPVVLL